MGLIDAAYLKSSVELFCDPPNSKKGFEELQDKCSACVLAVLYRNFENSGIDLESVAQEAWIQAWATKGSFCIKLPRFFKPYINRIAWNFALQELRRNRPGGFPENFDPADPKSDPSDDNFVNASHLMTEEGELAGQEPYIHVEDDDMRYCLDRLKQVNPPGFDALVSKTLGKHAEDKAMEIHGWDDRQRLYEHRYQATLQMRTCLENRNYGRD